MIVWFWQAVRAFRPEDRARLVMFWTGAAKARIRAPRRCRERDPAALTRDGDSAPGSMQRPPAAAAAGGLRGGFAAGDF